VFPRTIRTLDRATPVIQYARQYTPDLSAWFTKFAGVAGYYDANGHYARVQPLFAPTQLQSDGTLAAVNPANRVDPFQKGVFRRCPGGAAQYPPDGSAPVPAPGCDPSAEVPGP
jgi:phospholipid/cholesterol/gamma-HCH transport system substrate-binding protein